MKHLTVIAALACATMLMTSCTEDQSAFKVNNVPYRTNVQGKIVYNQGTTLDNGKFVYDYQPAANLEVFLIVSNGEYDGALAGNTILKTTTDEEGNYEFEVPVGINGAVAQVKTAQFTGTTKVVVRENNALSTKEVDVVYGSTKTISLQPQGYTFCNLECQGVNVTENPKSLTQYATLKGQINRNLEVYASSPQKIYNDDNKFIGYTNASVKYAFEPAANVDAIITVTYLGYYSNQSFNVTTNSNGYFELSVPVAEFPAAFSYEVDMLPVQNATFTHYVSKMVEYERPTGYGDATVTDYYVDYDSVKLSGYFSQTSWTTNAYNASYPVNSTFQQLFKGLVFHPFTVDQDVQGYNADSFGNSTPFVSDLED